MQLGKARFSGSCAAEGDIHAEELEIAGSLCAPAVEAERFHASGMLRINGLLNAGEITLSRGGLYQAGDIGLHDAPRGTGRPCDLARPPQARTGGPVHRGRYARAARYAGGRRPRALCRVGAGCVIDRVEYSEDLTVEDGGIVKEPVRC